MTGYAHNRVLLVTEHQTVRRGETIAQAGDTGDVSRPQVHFEIRRGGVAVDPMTVLPPRSR